MVEIGGAGLYGSTLEIKPTMVNVLHDDVFAKNFSSSQVLPTGPEGSKTSPHGFCLSADGAIWFTYSLALLEWAETVNVLKISRK